MGRLKRFKVSPPNNDKSASSSHSVPATLPTFGETNSIPNLHGGAAGSVSQTSNSVPQTEPQTEIGSGPSSGDTLPDDHSDSIPEEDDDHYPAPNKAPANSKKRKNYWIIRLIDDDGTITQRNMKVSDIWTLPIGKRIILPCNVQGIPIGDPGGLIDGFLGDLGSDFSKFPINYKSWRKVPNSSKYKVYDDIIKKKFIVENPLTKKWIIERMGKNWRETKGSVFHKFHDSTFTIAKNVTRRPNGIDLDQWTQLIQYRRDPKTQEMCNKNAENQQKQQYTYTGGSKSIARKQAEVEDGLGEKVSRGEMFILMHATNGNVYMNEAAKSVGEEIERIERQDPSSKILSRFDSLGQVLPERHGRV